MLCTLAVAAAGCGGPEPADEATTQAVTRTLRTYYDAFARADGARLCAVLRAETREGFGEDGESCVAAARASADAVPRELRDELRRLRVARVEVNGDEATATLRIDSAYASGPRTIVAGLRREDGGRWSLSRLPEERDDDDPAITCFASGMAAFEDGRADPIWQREGRADFAAYLRETCRRAVARKIIREGAGELSERQRADFQKVSAEVLREMVEAGRVRAP